MDMRKRTKKKVLFLLLTLLMPFSSWASGSILVLELDNGSDVVFKLLEKPVLTFVEGKLEISSQTFSTKSYNRSNIKKFYFSEDHDGLDELETSENTIIFKQTDDNRLVISNCPDSDRIMVSDLSGRLYNGSVSRNGSEAIVDLSNCPKGIYIIKIGNMQTIKISRK